MKIYSDILLACICFSCYMPPVYLFTDARLLPKWYLFVSVLSVTGLLAAVAWLRGKPLPDGIGALASFGKVFTIADKDIKVYSSAIWQIKENCK